MLTHAEKPFVRVEAGTPARLGLRRLLSYRDLLYFLIWRDVKVRYKQTLLGVAWALLQPVLLMLILTPFFGRFVATSADGPPYPVFVYAGLVAWTFFANAVASSGASLVSNSQLITKVYFPRALIPVASVGAWLPDLALALAFYFLLAFYYGTPPGAGVVMVPALVLLLGALALGVGAWAAALNVRYRDVRYALPFLIQLWMFASPILYPAGGVPARWRWVLDLNPLTGIVQGFRSALLNQPFEWTALGFSAAATLAVLAYATRLFRRAEGALADLV